MQDLRQGDQERGMRRLQQAIRRVHLQEEIGEFQAERDEKGTARYPFIIKRRTWHESKIFYIYLRGSDGSAGDQRTCALFFTDEGYANEGAWGRIWTDDGNGNDGQDGRHDGHVHA